MQQKRGVDPSLRGRDGRGYRLNQGSVAGRRQRASRPGIIGFWRLKYLYGERSKEGNRVLHAPIIKLQVNLMSSYGASQAMPFVPQIGAALEQICPHGNMLRAACQRSVLRDLGRPARGLDTELFRVLGIQAWPIEFHRFAGDDAPEGLAGKESIEHVEADVPAGCTH